MNRIIKLTTLFTILSFLFIACKDSGKSGADQEAKPAFDLAAAKKYIGETNQAISDLLAKGDSTALANLYTTDAKMMPPNEAIISGRNNILATWGYFVRNGMTGYKITPIDVWGSEALVGEEGTWTFSDKEGKELDHGKYVVLWKMEDGKWKLFRDCWNSDMPVMAPAK